MPAAITRRTPPPLLVKVMNPVVRAVLRSPLHRPASSSLLLLHLAGRKSGRHYDIPVGYHHVDGQLTVFTNSPWRANIRGGADLEITLAGVRRPMHADIDENPQAVARIYHQLIERIGWQAAQRRLGITIHPRRTPTITELEQSASASGLSVITLRPPAGTA